MGALGKGRGINNQEVVICPRREICIQLVLGRVPSPLLAPTTAPKEGGEDPMIDRLLVSRWVEDVGMLRMTFKMRGGQ